MPDVWINLAHCHLSQGQHVAAIKLYKACLERFYGNKDASVMLFLARAYFDKRDFASVPCFFLFFL